MNKLIKFYPREVGLPYRLKAKNIKELLKLVNQNNGIKTVYYSLYDFPYETCKLDKVHFDLDKKDALIGIKALHDYCKYKNYKHLMIFSGRRYQFYIFTKNYENIINKKNCLKNVQKYIAKECGLIIGDSKTCDIDFHLIGDIARLVRFPNTMHLATNLYCIPITEKHLLNGEEYIRNCARKQFFNFTYYNSELIDLSKFDYVNKVDDMRLKLDISTVSKINTDNILNKLPKCISNMLLMSYVPWRCRFHIIIYLREAGYNLNNIIDILEKFLKNKTHPEKNTDNFYHCIKEESNQIQRLYETEEYFFSCKKIKQEGYCVENCTKEIYL